MSHDSEDKDPDQETYSVEWTVGKQQVDHYSVSSAHYLRLQRFTYLGRKQVCPCTTTYLLRYAFKGQCHSANMAPNKK